MASPYHDVFSYLAPRAYSAYPLPTQGDWRVLGPSGQVVLFGSLDQNDSRRLPSLEQVKKSATEEVDYSKVKSKITSEETLKFLQRKRDREILRVKQIKQKEDLELRECTFCPRISIYPKRPRVIL